MVLLGVILVILAAVAGVLLFAGTAQLTDTVDIGILGGTLSLPPLTLLVTGMVVISLFWLGWALLRGGLRRGKRRRLDAKEAAAAAEAARLEDERRLKADFAERERQLLDERRREQEGAEATRVADTRTAADTRTEADTRSEADLRTDVAQRSDVAHRSDDVRADGGRSTAGPT